MSAFTEANRKAFNDLSASYNSKPWFVELSNQISTELQTRKDWLGAAWIKPDDPEGSRDVRLLDYACGTGAITRALGPYVHTIRGIDISENMVKAYNEAAHSSGLKPEQANAVVGDLLGATIPENLQSPEYQNFDVAAIGLGFHHFEDPALALKRLTERLKPETGVLVIIDFLPFEHQRPVATADGSSDMQHTIKQNGFTIEEMYKLFEEAGLEDFGFTIMSEPVVMELKNGTTERTVFIAKGRRMPTAWGKLKTWVGGIQDAIGGQQMIRPDQPGGNPMGPRSE